MLATQSPVTDSVKGLPAPALLWRALWGLWFCGLLLLLALIHGANEHQSALQTIGRDSAPSIIAAQSIKASLADMDADAANELLLSGGGMEGYNKRREDAAKALIVAAKNITYGDAEEVPIRTIQLGMGKYEALIQRAIDLRDAHNPSFVQAYESAANLLDSEVLPAADALDAANLSHLESAYSNVRTGSATARIWVGAAAFLTFALLIVAQRYLMRKTRRVFNAPLLAATALIILFTSYSLVHFTSAQQDLKRAKEDAFTSIHALWRASALAYSANADESRYLLNPALAQKHESDFIRKRNILANLSPGETYEDLVHAANPSMTGYLQDELNNITFPGEREAALETVHTFAEYVVIDGKIRNLERTGQHAAAIALCTGTKAGESDWTYEQFSSALNRTLDINQQAFDESVSAGFTALSHFAVKSAIAIVVFALLCMLGLLQRIREYR